MPKATNPLKWQGCEALIALGLCQFKLPSKLGGAPVFYRGQSDIVPFFVFTPYLKWGAVNTAGHLGLSFTDIDRFAKSLGKGGELPSFMIHTANYPGNLSRYINPADAERGAFKDWAASMDFFLKSYPTSAVELANQLQEGRLGGFRADQQFNARPPDDALATWLAARDISVPPPAPLPIRAVATSSAALQ